MTCPVWASPARPAEIGAEWRTPQYGQLLARPDCPPWARTFITEVSETLSRPEAFDSFGGWGGELLQARDGRFVLIDWPGLGAAPRGSLAAAALEVLLRFAAADPAPLAERFVAGWAPPGLDHSRLEDLRRWWAHGIMWWAGLNLSLGADADVDLTGVYAAARHCLDNDDPVSWLSPDASLTGPRPLRGGDGVGQVEIPVHQVLAGQRPGRAGRGDGVHRGHDPPPAGDTGGPAAQPVPVLEHHPGRPPPHPPAAPGNIASCRPRIRIICSATKSSRRSGVRPSMNSCTTQAPPAGAWPAASHRGAGQPRALAASTSSRAPSSRPGSPARHFSTALEPPPPTSRYAPSFQPPARRRSTCQRPPSSAPTAPSTTPRSTLSL
jgi:hypothetical protein